MESIDERIQKALSAEDRAFLAQMKDDGSLYRDLSLLFQGRTRWLSALAWLLALGFFAIAVVCGWHFATEPDLRSMQLWGIGTVLAFIALGMIKLWFWMELQKFTIVREIKRVELQVASLTDALRATSDR
ncbi:MAG TPA: DUF6768 family protein [Povalibacter sp.]|nr:DUF6768 family protein [Povalibacter sp.]